MNSYRKKICSSSIERELRIINLNEISFNIQRMKKKKTDLKSIDSWFVMNVARSSFNSQFVYQKIFD